MIFIVIKQWNFFNNASALLAFQYCVYFACVSINWGLHWIMPVLIVLGPGVFRANRDGLMLGIDHSEIGMAELGRRAVPLALPELISVLSMSRSHLLPLLFSLALCAVAASSGRPDAKVPTYLPTTYTAAVAHCFFGNSRIRALPMAGMLAWTFSDMLFIVQKSPNAPSDGPRSFCTTGSWS